MHLKQALEEFQNYLKAELNRPVATIEGYAKDLRILLKYLDGNGQGDILVEKITSEHLSDYLRYLTKEKSRFYDLEKFRRYLEENFALKELKELKIHHLRTYISHLSTEENYRPVSLGNVISALRSFYSFAVRKGFAATNLAQKIKKSKEWMWKRAKATNPGSCPCIPSPSGR
jgi:site-specific recombinase XerD